jgi:Flp pilus assembly protein TadD
MSRSAAFAPAVQQPALAAPALQFRRRTFAVNVVLVGLLALLCVVAFGPVWNNQFVLWDDDACLLTNHEFRGLGPAQVGWAWRTKLLSVYQPLAWMLYEVEYVFWGLDPRGYHAVSLFFHVANVLLLLVLAERLVRLRLPEPARNHPAAVKACAALSVALFALHPLRVEVVAWASCQPYLPCVTCYLLSLLAYVRYRTTTAPRRLWLALAWACFVLAFLFKAAAVTLPLVLVLLDWLVLPKRAGGRRFVPVERLVFFVPMLVFMYVTVWARDSRVPLASDGVFTRVACASASVWFYGLKSVVPVNLTNLYYVPPKLSPSDVVYLLSVVGLVIAGLVVFVWRKRWPMVWASCLGYLVLLAPASGLLRSGPQVFADRYSYLPMMAFTVAAAGGIFLIITRVPSRARVVLVPVVLVVPVLVVLSHAQCAVWRDSETLWRHNLAHGGEVIPGAHSQLGICLASQGRDDEALAEFVTALRLDPNFADAVHNVGLVMARRGLLQDAEPYFARAVELDPDRTRFLLDLASALVKQGRPAEALPHLVRAERLRPDHGETLVALGHCLGRLGRAAEAVPYLRRAVQLVPANAAAHGYLGIALLVQGAEAEARAELTEAVRLDPGQVNFRFQLGCLLVRSNDHEGALEQLREVQRLDPNHQGARAALDQMRYSGSNNGSR